MWQCRGNQQPVVAVGHSKKNLSGTYYLYQVVTGREGKGDSSSLLSLIWVIRRDWIIPTSTFTDWIKAQISHYHYFGFVHCLTKVMQFCCVMTVLVSDVHLIVIRWSHPILLFSQSHKFKNDWDFDLTLFWCFHNHTSLKMTEILISPVLSHGTINQKRTDS